MVTDQRASLPDVRTAGPARVEPYDKTLFATGAWATLDPTHPSRFGMVDGDTVLIRDDRDNQAVVRLSEAPSVDRGRGVLRLDSLTRMALGVRLGVDLEITAVRAEASPHVVLDIDERWMVPGNEEVGRRVRYELEASRTPLLSGSLVSLPVGPHGSHVLVRAASVDGHVGLIDSATLFETQSADLSEYIQLNNGGLADVGGLGPAVEKLREVVEFAIYRPEVLTRLGLAPAKGVILHGPPGGGKTLLCRSMAGEFDASFYYVSGPEVVGSLHGQTEEGLRAVFAGAADHSPSIICIDEVEALTRNRRALSNQADLRAVAQLLALMDGLRRAPGVFVIGTTNQVELIDPAFRRPGRFDREIAISLPDERSRLEILTIQTRSMPLSAAARAELPRIAEETSGYTGADLASLCQSSGLTTLRRFADSGGLRETGTLLATTDAIGVDDLRQAAAASTPASVRDGHFVSPKPEPLSGKTPALDRLRHVAAVVLGDLEADSAGAQSGVLLTGPSGSGKTAYIHHIVNEFDLRLLVINGPELASRWLGDTEESVRRLSELASRLKPSLLLLDHVEAMAPRASQAHDAGETRLVGQLAAVIAELTRTPGVLVVGATSRADLVDDLLLGSTGLRVRIGIDLPDPEDRSDIISGELARRGCPPLVDAMRRLADSTDGLTPADLVLGVNLAHHRWTVAEGPVLKPAEELSALLESEFSALVRTGQSTTDGNRA